MKGSDRFIIMVEVLALLALGAWGSVRVVNALGIGGTSPSSDNVLGVRVLGVSRNFSVVDTSTPEITGTPQSATEKPDPDEQMTGTTTPGFDEDFQEQDEEMTGMPNVTGTPHVDEDSQGQNGQFTGNHQDGSDESNQSGGSSGGSQNNSGGGGGDSSGSGD